MAAQTEPFTVPYCLGVLRSWKERVALWRGGGVGLGAAAAGGLQNATFGERA